MIKVLYSNLEGRKDKIFVDIDQIELKIDLDFHEGEPDWAIKFLLKKFIDESVLKFRLDPFKKSLEQTGNHINEETGKPYLDEEKDSEEDGLIEEDNIQLDLEDERDE